MSHHNGVAYRAPKPRSVLAVPDKFRGTATASEVAGAIERGAQRAGWACDRAPAADGGEGTLEALGGALRLNRVRGPLGDPVDAEWRLRPGGTAVVEMARASGLALVGGAAGNDPLRASTYGTGELIAAAIEEGARRVIVGLGGSATTDGGLGAVTALTRGRYVSRSVELVVACDVSTRFVDAAEVFAPQKGATAAQVALLRRRLDRLAEVYLRDHGVDVRDMAGSGAAGGLAGGLAAIGATLVPGFEVVADWLRLDERIAAAGLVITGEGVVDAESFEGKVVGGVVEMARGAGVPALVVAGDIRREEIPEGKSLEEVASLVSLVERFGRHQATTDVLRCIEEVVAGHLTSGGSSRPLR